MPQLQLLKGTEFRGVVSLRWGLWSLVFRLLTLVTDLANSKIKVQKPKTKGLRPFSSRHHQSNLFAGSCFGIYFANDLAFMNHQQSIGEGSHFFKLSRN